MTSAHRLMAGLLEDLVLFGTCHCTVTRYDSDSNLVVVAWIIGTAWEVLALCLVAWIVVKHLHELQRRPTGRATANFLTVLIKYHMFYFAG
jgi:hypothetical protein